MAFAKPGTRPCSIRDCTATGLNRGAESLLPVRGVDQLEDIECGLEVSYVHVPTLFDFCTPCKRNSIDEATIIRLANLVDTFCRHIFVNVFWISETDGATTTTDYDVGAFNRYDRVGGEPQIHDRAGNLLSDGTRSFEYDVHDRLASISPPGGPTLRLQRDPLGRLVGVDDGSLHRAFTYAGGRLIGWRTAGPSSASGHLVHARTSEGAPGRGAT